jgi:Response regulator containing CheY-like receiver domain and AraC-type DNA-binding domain
VFILKNFWIIGSKHGKKGKSFEESLIKLISSLLTVLFLSVIFLYYSSIKSIYSEQLIKSNDSIIEQVAISFEVAMKQIKDNIYKTPLYDIELIQMIKDYRKDILYQRDLIGKLDSIIIGNDYLYSAYLYLPLHNAVLSSESANSYPLEEFSDKYAIVQTKNGTINVLDPRQVDSIQGKKLFISVACPVPLYKGDYQGLLVVNIDANKLYYSLLEKIKTDDNMNFFVYTQDGTMIINKDATLLFKNINSDNSYKDRSFSYSTGNIFGKHEIITSTYYSQDLKWNFVLKTDINSTSTFITKLYSIALVFIGILVFGLFILILIVKHSAKPVKSVLSKYNEKLWVDFLTESNVNSDELENQIFTDKIHFTYDKYAIILIQCLKTDMNHGSFDENFIAVKKFLGNISPEYTGHAIAINKNLIAVILNFDNGNSMEEVEIDLKERVQILYKSISPDLSSMTYISISAIKDSLSMLPFAYRESIEALNYKIGAENHIVRYSGIRTIGQKLVYEYPYTLEKQIINNLIVGNPEACEIILEKFFGKLIEPDFCLSDSEIKTYIYQLQTSILKSVSSLPMQVKIESFINILSLYDLTEIKEKVRDFIIRTVQEINKTNENEETIMINSIFEYIDKRCIEDDFNLNTVADKLNLNRNYLAKIIKEKTGDYFNDYISKKRIEISKNLLKDRNLPIENIAHKVGYSYSNYFIKVFKSLEGITPGQYRDRVLENSTSLNEETR